MPAAIFTQIPILTNVVILSEAKDLNVHHASHACSETF